jgi:hypothetical protein
MNRKMLIAGAMVPRFLIVENLKYIVESVESLI